MVDHWRLRAAGDVSADTKVADTIRYDMPSIGSDTIPIR